MPVHARLGCSLSPEQRAAVDSLEASLTWWSPNSAVAAAALGRGTGKALSTQDAVGRLTKAAVSYRKLHDPYYNSSDTSTLRERRRGIDTGTFRVGSMKTFSAGPVVPVVASRIGFYDEPAFDPRPLLSPLSREVFEHPSRFLRTPTEDVPVARVLASQTEFLRLLELLDGSNRLLLRSASSSDRSRRVGLQCTYKDVDKDRLILDARPPNVHEVQLKRFIRHMANSSILLEIILEKDEILASYLDDIRDMYYVFQVSNDRAERNTFSREFRASEARHLRACPASAADHELLVASLRTMAMGDSNACEIAQESHLWRQRPMH